MSRLVDGLPVRLVRLDRPHPEARARGAVRLHRCEAALADPVDAAGVEEEDLPPVGRPRTVTSRFTGRSFHRRRVESTTVATATDGTCRPFESGRNRLPYPSGPHARRGGGL